MLNVPETPKIKTKVYENFKGVDLTNDSTNVWYRRSPSGVNMLPDASGRPFKRKGWAVVKSKADFQSILTEEGKPIEPFNINKCYYFTVDKEWLVVFTSLGVFSFTEGQLEFLSDDSDILQSYDRAFFFEGNGKSALYVYGGNKVWIFDGTLHEASQRLDFSSEGYKEEVYIPTILAGADASTGAGTILDGYNLLGGEVKVEYSNNTMCFAETNATDVDVTVSADIFSTQTVTRPNDYVFTKTASGWELGGTSVTISDYGITILGTVNTGETITVHYCYGVMLPQVVATSQVGKVKAFGSTIRQFDTQIQVVSDAQQFTNNNALLISNSKFSWLKFGMPFSSIVEGEDCVRVYYPSVKTTIDEYADENAVVVSVSGATLDREAV